MSESKTSFGAQLLSSLASLKITLVCLGFGMVIIFWGTIEQARLGIDQAVNVYFRSFIAWVPLPDGGLAPLLPGGFLVGSILLFNLIAAHIQRFKASARQIGIWMIHLGIIILLLGEIVSATFQRDSFMRMSEGETKGYAEAHRGVELAIVDRSSADTDKVVAIGQNGLAAGSNYQLPELPFRVQVRAFFANADIQRKSPGAPKAEGPEATQGLGTQFLAREIPLVSNPEERDLSAAWIELFGTQGSLGTWMVCDAPLFQDAQSFTHDGKTYVLNLRAKRTYLPFTLRLLDFTHDVYPGTTKPRDFASLVRLKDQRHSEDREVRIFMNNPLRYDGLTFYQHSFETGDTATVLQVVKNPGRHLPYISCALVGFGLLVHFIMHLVTFNKRRAAARVGKPAEKNGAVPWVVTGVVTVSLLMMAFRPEAKDQLHWREFGKLPVLVGGRIKPLDTVARTSLLVIHDKQTFRIPAGENDAASEARSVTAIEWLAEVLFAPVRAAERKVFTIHDPQVLDLFGGKRDGEKYFSYAQIRPFAAEIERQAQLANDVEGKLRTPFQNHVLDLYRQIDLFQRLRNSVQPDDAENFPVELAQFEAAIPALQKIAAAVEANKTLSPDEVSLVRFVESHYTEFAQMAHIRVVPPVHAEKAADRTAFLTMGEAVLHSLHDGALPDAVKAYTRMGVAYRANNIAGFDEEVGRFTQSIGDRYAPELTKTSRETFLNRYAPFYLAMVVYVLVFALGSASWLTERRGPLQTAFLLTGLALILHTSGIVFRMVIEGRPPVTNLYSSALFVGYVAVIVAFILEWIFRNAIGSVVAGVIGFCTLLVAHHLSLGGDTMEMMQAVLDSNFWLATHVVVVTAGYGATFMAGFLGLTYLVLGLFTTKLQPESARTISRMTYGVICFALLCSFVGTVLGGIWADQSWGRFWGWDPKENGAVLIVLWNAIVLHARWGGFVRDRGVAIMAVFGNAVTAWSWFGTNMLGIGLHSYGFMDKAFIWLMGFVIFQLVMMAVGNLPLEKWRSPMKSVKPPPVTPQARAGAH